MSLRVHLLDLTSKSGPISPRPSGIVTAPLLERQSPGTDARQMLLVLGMQTYAGRHEKVKNRTVEPVSDIAWEHGFCIALLLAQLTMGT